MTSAHSSPYVVTTAEFVQRFATNAVRCTIVDGFMRYRAELRVLGFVQGFQWLDGSFVEDVESREGREPRDMDIVTFAHPPAGMSNAQIRDMMRSRPELFDQDQCKAVFRCDTALVNLSTSPEWLVTQTRYWYGLYSHRRGDALWKGILQLPLDSNDLEGNQMLAGLNFEGENNAGAA
ncbi:hypothetical protein [Acidovorax sp. SUPP3334]|uniref:DUF6932 family protein n=1 Tax=Acidovorax sp. SUPP3334 TaxID=2920881 RepID=UPI0023DE4425|nr:hypothetical protein [Acidovorax sp. SUPP3334]GKT25580.1 hypothetical protein AVHM3334_18370 [Acidovorax sp. SUPP3334]